MYPTPELRRLQAHKARLRRDIAVRRREMADAALRLSRPLAFIDKVLAWWRRVSPIAKFAAVPLGAVLTRMIFRRMKGVGRLVRWAPLIFNVVRGFRAGAKSRA
jgi:hypothetical protein